MTSVKLINPLIYIVISNKYATLKELRDDYDVLEFVELYEMCMVNIHNKHTSIENARKRSMR